MATQWPWAKVLTSMLRFERAIWIYRSLIYQLMEWIFSYLWTLLIFLLKAYYSETSIKWTPSGPSRGPTFKIEGVRSNRAMITQCFLTINIQRSLCTVIKFRMFKEATNQIHSYFAPLFPKKKVGKKESLNPVIIMIFRGKGWFNSQDHFISFHF